MPPKLKMHYWIEGKKFPACGQAVSAMGTKDTKGVTCKKCRRTMRMMGI